MGMRSGRSFKVFLFLGVLIVAVLAGFWFLRCYHRIAVQIYYPEKNALFLVPVTRFVSAKTPEVLLNELKKAPRNPQLLPGFPDVPVSITTKGKTIILNFIGSPPFEQWPFLERASLATFKQLPDFDTVLFANGNNPDTLSNGREVEPDSLADFSVNDNLEATPMELRTAESPKAVLYFVLKGTRFLVPVTVHVHSGMPVEQAVAQALQENSPFSWILDSSLPPGSKILSVSHPRPDRIELELQLTGTLRQRSLARKALRLTYTEMPSIRRVKIKEAGRFWRGWFACPRPCRMNREGSKAW